MGTKMGRYVIRELVTVWQDDHWEAMVQDRGAWYSLTELNRSTGATLVSTYPHDGEVLAVFLTLPDEE